MSSRAGGLYGGIQFSSGATRDSSIPESEQPQPSTGNVAVSEPSSAQPPEEPSLAASSTAGKSTAGIDITASYYVQPV